MKLKKLVLVAGVYLSCAELLSAGSLQLADKDAALKSAGHIKSSKGWHSECNDISSPDFEPATIEKELDLDGDGRPELLITEYSSMCYGVTGTGFSLVSKQRDNTWKVLASGVGIPKFLGRKGLNGWPDMEISGPGFCFDVLGWSGEKYILDRREYQGMPCKLK